MVLEPSVRALPHYPLLHRPGPCQGRGLPSGITHTEAGLGSGIWAELFSEHFRTIIVSTREARHCLEDAYGSNDWGMMGKHQEVPNGWV